MPFVKRSIIIFILSFFVLSSSSHAYERFMGYTIKPGVNLRSGPGLNFKVKEKLRHNRTVFAGDKSKEWVNVITDTGVEGYVHYSLISDLWIKIYKDERLLIMMKGDNEIKRYSVALCPFNPDKDKIKQGDGGTPEGRFYICEMLENPGAPKYGARSMRLSYPGIEDAGRGLRDKLINYETYKGILKDIHQGIMPSQGTVLGGSIRIHGGGSGRDWTLGCAALDDEDIIEIFNRVKPGTRVEVYRNEKQDKQINSSGYLSRLVLEGAKKQLVKPALYTKNAAGLIKLSYPMGDITEKEAVCTDIVIRALRHAGADLQALLHEEIILRPELYRNIKNPDYNIDHRRTRNLQTFFSNNAMTVFNGKGDPDKTKIKPGDIVILDTGIKNGTVYDHIGIIDDEPDASGWYRVINIWTTGYRTESMSLLGHDYPEVTGIFRLSHPFDYQ